MRSHIWTIEPGRTLCRDGVPVFELSRYNLGNCRYATSPHEADVLVRAICDHLNGLPGKPEHTPGCDDGRVSCDACTMSTRSHKR